MPDIGSSSVTASPSAGLLVVLSVTVPLTVAACAIAQASKKPKPKIHAPNRFKIISCRRPSFCCSNNSLCPGRCFPVPVIITPAAIDQFRPSAPPSLVPTCLAEQRNPPQDTCPLGIQSSNHAGSRTAVPCVPAESPVASFAFDLRSCSPAKTCTGRAQIGEALRQSGHLFRSSLHPSFKISYRCRFRDERDPAVPAPLGP